MFLVGAAGLTVASVDVYWRVADPSQRSQSSEAFETPYDSKFFAELSAGSASSATQILPGRKWSG
jgi:hypothetical protein